jgi:hypothetical protein
MSVTNIIDLTIIRPSKGIIILIRATHPLRILSTSTVCIRTGSIRAFHLQFDIGQ